MVDDETTTTSTTTTTTTTTTDQQHPRIEQVLAAAERDLDNADFHFGLVFNPLRFLVAKPAVHLANFILPPVASKIPLVDNVASTVWQCSADACKTVYHAAHSEQDDATYQIHHQTEKDFFAIDTKEADKMMQELELKGTVVQTKGFLVSAAIEIVSDPISNASKWLEFTKQLTEYLIKAGIADEIKTAMASPHWGQCMRILGQVQAVQDNVEIRRNETAIMTSSGPFSTTTGMNGGTPRRRSSAQVAKLMRYCCAAYGQEMMEAYDIVAQKNNDSARTEKYKNMVGSEALKQQVCDYVGIPTSYITYFCMGHGGSMELLRHYISIDHELGAVCFVIRGTYSVSGWHIDFQGQAVPFMNGGQAHKGISEMAKNLVLNSRKEIIAALQLYPDYKLIITGQSLGGGVSPLVNLLCHADPVIGKHAGGVECHAFAGPPVYCHSSPEIQPSNSVQRAIANCIHYVHDSDIVPYLSVHTVRRLNAKILALDKVVSQAPFLDPALIAAGRKTPTPAMVSAVLYGDDDGTPEKAVKPVSGAPVLITPCKEVVWFRQDPDTQQVDYMICDPEKFVQRGILLSVSGTADHVPPKYCQILNYAEEHGWEQKKPRC